MRGEYLISCVMLRVRVCVCVVELRCELAERGYFPVCMRDQNMLMVVRDICELFFFLNIFMLNKYIFIFLEKFRLSH